VSNPYLRWIRRNSQRAAITLVGFALIALGLVLLPLPGPFTIAPVIAGLAVLAREYTWARKALDEAKKRAQQARAKVRRKKKKNS
jgi:hypothetical protein